MGELVLFLGLAALLWMLFRREGGYALVGSTIGLAVCLLVMLWVRDAATSVGFLYLAVALALWATSPPAEELAEPIGGTLPGQRDREDPNARIEPIPQAPPSPPTGDSLTLKDHLWLSGLPLLGFLLTFVAVDRKVGLIEGLWFHLISGTPGAGFAFGVTDVAAIFGLLLIFPGGQTALALPVTGLIAVLFQLGKNRPTAAAAAMEYGVLLVVMNLALLIFLPSKG